MEIDVCFVSIDEVGFGVDQLREFVAVFLVRYSAFSDVLQSFDFFLHGFNSRF